jgi:hypothetical protein
MQTGMDRIDRIKNKEISLLLSCLSCLSLLITSSLHPEPLLLVRDAWLQFPGKEIMPVENRGTAKRPRWRYAFTIRAVRHRAAIPEAMNKYEAEQAEVGAKKAICEGQYGEMTGERDVVEFMVEVYLPWARENKRSWRGDEICPKRRTATSAGRCQWSS